MNEGADMAVAATELRSRNPELDREPVDQSDHMIQARSVADRYNISVRTLDRWLQRPHLVFPKPAVVTRDVAGHVSRRFWRIGDLVAWERRQAALCAKSA
jgi:hypothetical protein